MLVHAFPEADIPVVQLSLNAEKDLDYHLGLGAALAPLRDSGVLVVASGNIVHNLGGMDRRLADEGYDWARRFDDGARELCSAPPAPSARSTAHRDFTRAVPTPDHFLPLIYLAGLADAGGLDRRPGRRLRLRLAVDDRLHPGPDVPRRGRRSGSRRRAARRRPAGPLEHLIAPRHEGASTRY